MLHFWLGEKRAELIPLLWASARLHLSFIPFQTCCCPGFVGTSPVLNLAYRFSNSLLAVQVFVCFCCRKMLWRSGPSQTALKNTSGTASWSDATLSSMRYAIVILSRVRFRQLSSVSPKKCRTADVCSKSSDVSVFMKKWPFAYRLTYAAFLPVVSAPERSFHSLCSWCDKHLGGRAEERSLCLENHRPSLSLWDLSLCLLVYITYTHTHKFVKDLNWSHFFFLASVWQLYGL